MIHLKDVIHYYIGQKCIHSSHHEPQNEPYVLTAKNLAEAIEFGDRPVLRRLEDMTKEEKARVGYSAMIKNEIVWTPEKVHYLLKQGFDLWNLIDSKQAVDLKTLNQKV